MSGAEPSWTRGQEIPEPVVLASTPNFRDVGGLPTLDGRRTRHGVLYRTEGPAMLSDEDAERLRNHNFKLVIDFRSPGERTDAPNHWVSGAENLLHLDLMTDMRVEGNDGWDILRADPTERGARQAMSENYRAMAGKMGGHLRQALDRMIEHGEVPALIHCTAGKDRTGVSVALILLAAGVDPDAVIEDYSRSTQHIATRQFPPKMVESFTRNFDVPPDVSVLKTLSSAHPEFLQAALDEIVARSGSVDAYLEREAGLTDARRARLRDILVV